MAARKSATLTGPSELGMAFSFFAEISGKMRICSPVWNSVKANLKHGSRKWEPVSDKDMRETKT